MLSLLGVVIHLIFYLRKMNSLPHYNFNNNDNNEPSVEAKKEKAVEGGGAW